MTSFADKRTEPPTAPKQGDYTCGDCPESFQTPAARYNHRRGYHGAKQHSDRPTRNFPTEAPVEARDVVPSEDPELATPSAPTEVVGVFHELTRRFSHALSDIVPEMPASKKRQIILAFDAAANSITASHSDLNRFLTMAGITGSQAQLIKLVLLGVDDPPPSGYGAQNLGGPQAIIWDSGTGQWVTVPIYMFPANYQYQPQPYYYYP